MVLMVHCQRKPGIANLFGMFQLQIFQHLTCWNSMNLPIKRLMYPTLILCCVVPRVAKGALTMLRQDILQIFLANIFMKVEVMKKYSKIASVWRVIS